MEEQYYLIWPMIVWLCSSRSNSRSSETAVVISDTNHTAREDDGRSARIPHSRVQRVSLLVASLIYWSICYVMRRIGFDGTLLLTRGDGFALGSLLAIVFTDVRWSETARVNWVGILGLAGAGGLAVVAANLTGWMPIGTTNQIVAVNVGGFGLVGLAIMLASRPSMSFLRLRPLCFIGTISYGLYVYHMYRSSGGSGSTCSVASACRIQWARTIPGGAPCWSSLSAFWSQVSRGSRWSARSSPGKTDLRTRDGSRSRKWQRNAEAASCRFGESTGIGLATRRQSCHTMLDRNRHRSRTSPAGGTPSSSLLKGRLCLAARSVPLQCLSFSDCSQSFRGSH